MLKGKVLRIILAVAIAVCLLIPVLSDGFRDFTGYSHVVLSYYGSRGDEVTNIQKKLKQWGYYEGNIDGVYGYQTYKAVRYFQYKNGLKVDGVVGSETLSALGLPTGVQPSANNKDLNLLAHIIHGEARGEPYIGQVAVAAVILNRVQDSRFPTTVAGVIYQPGAFDAVSDGQINLEPTSESYKAARDALNGWDPTYGCIYYYNPATATSKWIWTRPIILAIGKHNFAR
ncbi:MAG: spore cortex-lytic enzyme [Desulfitobacteriaceae bacterium]|nr:spore cortex-lytic enzyme [Desulfitobacteriaceae bacterium]MDD4296221.1 spore cortex-lytic enzyme [Ruminiclostridium sp.]